MIVFLKVGEEEDMVGCAGVTGGGLSELEKQQIYIQLLTRWAHGRRRVIQTRKVTDEYPVTWWSTNKTELYPVLFVDSSGGGRGEREVGGGWVQGLGLG